MAVETLTYVYTSQDEIERLMSEVGVQLRLRDLTGADSEGYITRLLASATDLVNQWVDGLYHYEDLVNNLWVRERATWIALTFLCRRKGNAVPKAVLERYEEILEDLRNAKLGIIQIPRLATRADMTPAMSNMRVDDRFRHRKIRVNPSISTGGNDGSQDLDWWYNFDLF